MKNELSRRYKYILEVLLDTTFREHQRNIAYKAEPEVVEKSIRELYEEGGPGEKFLLIMEALNPGFCEELVNMKPKI